MKKIFMTLAAVLCCAMTTAVFTACSDNEDNPTPDPTTPKEAEYTIIFYGQGGKNLDAGIMNNISQFFQGNTLTFKKVKVVGQYKFSTAENMEECGIPEDYASRLGGNTYRFVIDRKITDEDAWMDDKYIYGEDNCDITNPDSLTNFINWAAKVCPAKHYMLIISDHGGGYQPHDDLPYLPATRGLVYDDGNNKNHFTITSLTSALRAASIRLQVIYLDACLMNTVEYQFELKDLCDYYMASTFCVPGVGGDYATLVNGLATESDIEKVLTDVVNSNIERWGSEEFNGVAITRIFNDQTVTRTANLDDFGVALKAFTDKLVEAYQNGDQTVKDAIDECTGLTFKVESERPSYDLIDYIDALCDALPEVFPATLRSQVNDAFEACVVKAGRSETLVNNDLSVELSVLIGFDNCYVYNGKALGEQGEVTEAIKYYYADGSSLLLKPAYPDFKAEGTWGSTFDATYKQLAFDKAVGWSRWIEVNKQMPCQTSPTTWSVDFFNDVLDGRMLIR